MHDCYQPAYSAGSGHGPKLPRFIRISDTRLLPDILRITATNLNILLVLDMAKNYHGLSRYPAHRLSLPAYSAGSGDGPEPG